MEYDDLLGGDPPPPTRRKPGRPRRERTEKEVARKKATAATRALAASQVEHYVPTAADLAEAAELGEDYLAPGDPLPEATAFMRPVRVTFLAAVFGVQLKSLYKKLAHCPVVKIDTYGGRKVPLYDFKTACEYFLVPRMNIETYIKSLNPAQLPPYLNKAFWDGQVNKLRWEAMARESWHNDDVLDVLGATAMHIKESCQLAIENLPGRASLSDAQNDALLQWIAAFQNDIHQRLVAMPAARRTESAIKRVNMAEIGDTEPFDPEAAE